MCKSCTLLLLFGYTNEKTFSKLRKLTQFSGTKHNIYSHCLPISSWIFFVNLPLLFNFVRTLRLHFPQIQCVTIQKILEEIVSFKCTWIKETNIMLNIRFLFSSSFCFLLFLIGCLYCGSCSNTYVTTALFIKTFALYSVTLIKLVYLLLFGSKSQNNCCVKIHPYHMKIFPKLKNWRKLVKTQINAFWKFRYKN